MIIDQLQFPASNDFETRISWAGERVCDIAEGLISREAGEWIVTLVIGWSDLGTEEERANYREMARQIREVLQAAA